MPEYVWIYYNKQDSEYVSYNTYCKVTLQVNEYLLRDKHIQNPSRAQNMVRLWICEGYTGCWICLNKPDMPEYALIMYQYAYATLNINEYASIYLTKQSVEYAKILNVSDAVY